MKPNEIDLSRDISTTTPAFSLEDLEGLLWRDE